MTVYLPSLSTEKRIPKNDMQMQQMGGGSRGSMWSNLDKSVKHGGGGGGNSANNGK